MRLPWSKGPNLSKQSDIGITSTSQADQDATELAVPDKKRPEVIDQAATRLSISRPVTADVDQSDNGEADREKHSGIERTISTATESSAGQPGEDDESKYPTGIKLYLLTMGLTLSTFVVALDNTIIATAIPRITTVFDSLDDVGWYGSSYLLTTTSLQPSFGKVYTYFNVKWTYISALCIFELGSVLCGAATSSVMLIVGRAVAGAGAAALFSGGMNIIAYSVPLRKRPIYIGLLSSMFGIASVVGPILGGAFTDSQFVRPPHY